MLVKNILEQKDRDTVTAEPGMSVEKAMEALITNNISCLPVVENGTLVGIISDKDIFKKIFEATGDYKKLNVKDIMTENPLVGVPDDELEYVAGVMDQNWIRHIPIVQGDKVVGIVSQRDVIHFLHHNATLENRYLNLYMESLHRRDKSGDQ